MNDLKNIGEKTYPNLNSKKMKNRITLFEFLISNTLLILFNFITVYPIVFILNTLNMLSSGLPNSQITLCAVIALIFIEKLLLYMYNTDPYYYVDLKKTNNKLKFINIINPNTRKNSEFVLENFSDIGYYFDEDISFIEKNTLNGLLSFRDNDSLKKYIKLVVTDSKLSEQLSKIVMISRDGDFKKIQDSEIKSLIISEVFVDLVKLSIPRIIEYNEINKKSKIEMTFDNYFTNDFHKDLEKLRVINRKLFKKFNSENYSFSNPDILNIFTDTNILEKSKGLLEVNNYVFLLKELNGHLEDIINMKEDSRLKKLNSNIDSLKEVIIGKYTLM